MLIIGIAGGTEAENYRSSSDYEWITRQKSGFLRILIIENKNLSFDERALINFDHPRAIDFELLVAHLKS
jgi:uridine kinase